MRAVTVRRLSLVLLSIVASGGWAGPVSGAGSPQELADIRSTLLTIRGREAGPEWPVWQVSDVSCAGPGLFDLESYESGAIAKECGVDSIGLLTELSQVAFPEGGKGRLREGVEFVATGAGMPITALRCAARGMIVHRLRGAGSSDAEIESWRKRVDALTEAAAIISTLHEFGTEMMAKGPAGYATREGLARGVGDAGTVSGAEGSVGTFTAAWRSFHGTRLGSFDSRMAEARRLAGACRLPQAESLGTDVLADALGYLRDKRLDVVHYEKKVFCDAAAADQRLSVRDRIAASPFERNRSDALQLEAEAGQAVDKLEAALGTLRQDLLRESRERDAFLAQVDAVVGRYHPARVTCDRPGLLAQQEELRKLASHRCANGAGKADDLAHAIGRIDQAIRALDDAELKLGTGRDQVRAALRACRTEEAQAALGSARRELAAAIAASPIPLDSCPELQLWLPVEELAAEIAARRQELAGRKQRARDVLAQARSAASECRFDEAWGFHEAAGSELGSCSVDPGDCGDGGSFDRDLCTFLQLEGERLKVEGEIGAAESRYHEASATIASSGQELQVWGREALARARSETPERCAALTEVREAAQGLESLAAPSGCPDPRIQAYRDEGARLRAQVDELEAGLSRREADLLATAEAAASACDPEALKQAVEEIERLQANACGRSGADLGALRRRLAEVEEGIAEGRRILLEAEEDLAAWLERCDPARLATTGAGITKLVSCGWEGLADGERARALVLRDWGAASAELIRLKAELSEIGMPLLRATRYLAAAEQRLADGDRSEESRQTLALEKDRATAALAEARAILDRLAAAPLMSSGCLARPRAELAASEDRLRRLGDLSVAGDGDPTTGTAVEAEGDGPGSAGGPATSGSVTRGDGGTLGGVGTPLTALVAVPDLFGKSRAMAEALLADLGLHPVVTIGGGAPPSGKPGKVASQTHPAGSALPKGSFVGVTLWGEHVPAAPPPVPAPSAALSQADCDRGWPGTVLRSDPATGATSCQCPSGTAWSKVSHACLSLGGVATGTGVATGGDCRHMPGTIRDSRTGECRCAIGNWDATLRRCVDTAAAAREKDVASRRTAADCENLFSKIKVFRSNPDALSRNMAAAAEGEARALGCDPARIAEATTAGPPPPPPPVAGGTGRQPPPPSGGTGTKAPATCRVMEQGGGGGITLVYEQTALGNHYNVYVFSVPKKDLAAVKGHWNGLAGFRLVGSFGSYGQGLTAAQKACSSRTAPGREAGSEAGPCNCVDERGRRYSEAFGQPCGTGGQAIRDYGCP